jgi:CRISPR/Cas system CMR subunit Cmr4 (Cas7 group RAMP superfamily)
MSTESTAVTAASRFPFLIPVLAIVGVAGIITTAVVVHRRRKAKAVKAEKATRLEAMKAAARQNIKKGAEMALAGVTNDALRAAIEMQVSNAMKAVDAMQLPEDIKPAQKGEPKTVDTTAVPA